ncbi:unnamed protein product, partial [Meganyctiphanes norvegica]
KTKEMIALNDHLHTHSEYKVFACLDCAFTSYSNIILNKHILSSHPGLGLRCSTCDIIITTKKGIMLHVKEHKDMKPYACSYCEYKSYSKIDLGNHLHDHLGNGRLSCPHCDYKCEKYMNMNRHILSHVFAPEDFLCLC